MPDYLIFPLYSVDPFRAIPFKSIFLNIYLIAFKAVSPSFINSTFLSYFGLLCRANLHKLSVSEAVFQHFTFKSSYTSRKTWKFTALVPMWHRYRTTTLKLVIFSNLVVHCVKCNISAHVLFEYSVDMVISKSSSSYTDVTLELGQ